MDEPWLIGPWWIRLLQLLRDGTPNNPGTPAMREDLEDALRDEAWGWLLVDHEPHWLDQALGLLHAAGLAKAIGENEDACWTLNPGWMQGAVGPGNDNQPPGDGNGGGGARFGVSPPGDDDGGSGLREVIQHPELFVLDGREYEQVLTQVWSRSE